MTDRPTFADQEVDRLARIGAAVLERVDEEGKEGFLPLWGGHRYDSYVAWTCPACGEESKRVKMEDHAGDCPLTRYLEATDE